VKPFPKDYELLSIFESDPELSDADVPWFYNTLTFRGEWEGQKYLIMINPSYGQMEVRFGDPSSPFTHLSITEVLALRLHEGHREAVLMVSFSPDSGRGLLKIRLKPKLSIEWVFDQT
jgi:hypothetical protein